MQRRLRRGEELGSLPPLEQAAESSSDRPPPRVLRFEETSLQQHQAQGHHRRVSRLPELARRESIISTYRSELYQPRTVTFMKNGDRFFEGIKVNVSSRNFRHWEVLLSELSRSIDLPAGVRHIYTPETGHRVTSLDQFQNQKVYVCASTEPFKRIGYSKVRTPTWHSGTKVRHTGTLLDISRGLQARGRGRDQPFVSPSPQTHPVEGTGLQSESEKERKRKRCARKLSFAKPSESEVEDGQISPSRRRRTRHSSIAPPQPSKFTVICTGEWPWKKVTVFLDRHSITSWEQALSLFSEALPGSSGLTRLCSVDGVEVESLSQLWATDGVLITPSNSSDLNNFIHGAESQKPSAQVDQGIITEEGNVVGTKRRLTPDISETQHCHSETSAVSVTAAVTAGKGRCCSSVEETENAMKLEDSKGRKREREAEYLAQAQKMDISETTLPERVPAPGVDGSPVEPMAGQGEGEVQPTNSLLTLTGEESFLGSGSPLTVDKVAAVQHLHRLALQYGTDHYHTNSGSDTSTHIRQLSSGSRASVLCPGSPQSNISLNNTHSIVEMIMPRENGSGCSMSSSSRNSSQPKSRTVGIQTDLVGDKLSAIIEEDEQPLHLGMSHMKRRATHPLFHTQTSITSQLNTESSSQSPKESYSVGPILAEGRFAAVRECRHKVTGQQYSLRVISKAEVFGRDDLVWREYEMLRGLRHENLVQVVDGWESSDDIYMVAEHIEGTDLFDAVLHCQHFCEADANHAMRQLSMALVYLHAHKIVHRDIKLENIFLHQAGEGRWSLKLGGMGLATTISEPLSLVCGNIFYMAPEMIAQTGYGTKLDVWAAGVVCCTLLSGIMPFGSNSKRATVSNITKGRYAFLSPFWDEVSEEAKGFVCHLLVVSPSKRYMASQMLQHNWLERERWKEPPGDSERSRTLMEHLVSKAASTRNAALPTLVETALDKRRSLPNIDLLKKPSFKSQRKT